MQPALAIDDYEKLTVDPKTDRPKDVVALFTEYCEKGELEGRPETGRLAFLEFTAKLIDEEIEETKAAIAKYRSVRDDVLKKDVDPLVEKTTVDDVLDGAADVAFLAINLIYKTFRHRGLSTTDSETFTRRVLTRVGVANLRKRFADGTFHFQGNADPIPGKMIKPEGWSPPTFLDLIP